MTDLEERLILHYVNVGHDRKSIRDFVVTWHPKHLALAVKNELMSMSMQPGTMEQRMVEWWERFGRSVSSFATRWSMQRTRTHQAQRQMEEQQKKLDSECG